MVSSSYFGLNGACRTSNPARRPHAPWQKTDCGGRALSPCGAGKSAANIGREDLDIDAPKELLNLDVLHKRSTARNVEQMNHGRFSTAPRNFFGGEGVFPK